MKNQIILYFFFGFLCSSLYAQQTSDPDFRHSRLPNGFTYFIRHTDFEPGHAEFYLVQNVGALMEEDNQNGLAHFLEHMAFNGSLNFPQGIPTYLKNRGVTRHNAYTGQNETVYHINRVPTGDPGLVDSCLLILHDWSGFLTLAPEAIRKERGIILEERRMRRDLGMRMEEQVRPYMYNYTKYASHDVVGTEEVLKNFTRQELQDYYHDYYRPDQQAAIIVGDIDAEKVEQEIIRLFSPIPKRENPKPRVVYEIPDHETPMYAKVIDKEVPGNAVILMKRIRQERPATLEGMMKNNLLQLFYNNIVKRQFAEYVEESNPDFLQASINYQGLVRGYSALHLFMRAYPGKDLEGLRQLLETFGRINRTGLTEAVLQEEKNGYLSSLDESEKAGFRFPNSVYVEMYRAAFLENKLYTTVEEDIAMSRRILAEMTAADLQAWVNRWYDDDRNWLFIMQGSDSTYRFPTEKEIVSMLQESRTTEPSVRQQQEITARPLIDFEIRPGKIVKSRQLKKTKAEQWTLSNGLTVYYKYNRYEEGKVTLFGIGKGGTSVLAAEDLPSASALNTFMLVSGVYHHDNRMMAQIMKDKKVAMQLKLGGEAQTLNASGEGKDVDTMFCLAYLQLTNPRFSRDDFEKFVYAQVQDYLSRPRTVEDTLSAWMQQIRYTGSPRLWKQDTAYFRAMDFDRMQEIYKEFFGNPDFTFYIVGDISPDRARRLAETYLASLPVVRRNIQPVKYDFRRRGSVKETFTADIPGEKYMINIEFTNRLRLTPEEQMTLRLLQLILQDRYHYTIREAEGGSYSINVQAVSGEEEQFLGVTFESSLDKGDRMREEVHKQIRRLINEGVGEEDFDDQVLVLRKELAKREFQPTNATLVNEIKQYLETGKFTEPNEVLEKRLEKLRQEDVRRLAQKFFSTAECKDLGVKSR